MSIFGKAFFCVTIYAKDHLEDANISGSGRSVSNLESTGRLTSGAHIGTSKDAIEK